MSVVSNVLLLDVIHRLLIVTQPKQRRTLRNIFDLVNLKYYSLPCGPLKISLILIFLQLI